MKIILVNGMPESGKTTFEKFCQEELYINYDIPCEIYSTINPIKNIAKKIGWNGKKTPKDRRFLSDLKDLCTKYSDYSISWIKSKINTDLEFYHTKEEIIFFIDTREPEEIERLKKEWGAKALLVRRATVENKEHSNHADANVFQYEYDYIIKNIGTLEDLKKIAKNFIMKIENEEWESEIK